MHKDTDNISNTPTSGQDSTQQKPSGAIKAPKPARKPKFGLLNWVLVVLSIALIPLIMFLWTNINSTGSSKAAKSQNACVSLGGKITTQQFPAGKKQKTLPFTLCKDSKGKILMSTGYVYNGTDLWVSTCPGKVFAEDTKDKQNKAVSRSLICLAGGKVTKSTNVDL